MMSKSNQTKPLDLYPCKNCCLCTSERCPLTEVEIDERLYGCYRFSKKAPKNPKQQKKPTKCSQCRFLFRKPKSDNGDRSYIMCGFNPGLTEKINPPKCCENFKPLRKKQRLKREAFRKTRFRSK